MDPTLLARLALLSALLAVSNPAAAPPTQPPIGGETTYIVQTGDTLSAIAVRFNTTVEAIVAANNLDNPNSLTLGQRLRIPASGSSPAAPTPPPGATRGSSPPVRGPTATPPSNAPTRYTVKAGDTLAAIAERFGVTVQEIADANQLTNVNLLSVGQVLVIPKGATPTPTVLPQGIEISPSQLQQGNTLVLKLTAADVTTATGKFDTQTLRFVRDADGLVALIGISRCANVADYPVSIHAQDTAGGERTFNFSLRVNRTNYPVYNLTLTAGMSSLLDPAIMNAENTRVTNTIAPFTAQKLWQGPFRSPLNIPDPRISSSFGERRSYNGGAPGLCGHEGQDYAVDGGTPVYAPAGGIVALAAPLKVRGNVVFLDHGLGVYSGFFHLNEIDVRDGQRVKPGDLLGKVGTTGFSTGFHLHWSMWVNGVYVDPIEWTRRTIP